MTIAEEKIVPTIGVHYNVPFAEYAAWDAINWHLLSPFRVSAKQGRHEMLSPANATDTQVFGAAFHCAILEPDCFKRDYAVMPKFEGHPNSKKYQDAKAAWQAAYSGSVHLTHDEMAELRAMSDSVRSNPIGAAILAGKGRNELSIVWRDAETDVLCKGRIDRLCRVKIGILDPLSSQPNADAIVMVDFKTTHSIEPIWFNKERAKYAYHGQCAFYLDGLNTLQPAPMQTLIGAVQNDEPFDTVFYQPDDDALENGRKLYRRLLNQFLSCRAKKHWPGISERIVPLSIDPWERENKLED